MNKMERDVVIPSKPKFYKRFVDDIYRRRKRNEPDELFDKMNSYHPYIKLTIEINLQKILDTKIIKTSNQVQCFMYQQGNKQPIHWNSAVPKSCKRNVIIGDVHRAKRKSCDLDYEILVKKSKYIKAGYPPRFVTSVINTCTVEKEDPIIPSQMFDGRKTVYFRLPFCKTNERKIRSIVDKLEEFTNNKVKFIYHWKTRKLKSLFPLKERIKHKANIVYKRTCSGNESHIGETKRHVEIRWKEYCSNNDKKSEVAEHLLKNPRHTIDWRVITSAPHQRNKRKIFEAYYITKFKRSLNNQLDIKITHLFRNGIT